MRRTKVFARNLPLQSPLFHRNGKRLALIHTEVPEAPEGRGLASLLAKTALDYARSNDLTVVPICPFVRSYLEKHPDEAARTKLDLTKK